ncbi:MAG TPA: sigma-70 family RNA polymerase sigma factor [Anaerolineae bacterium]|nr:sigma-70 family RNA polymerase sigma factor [Anaerolineae bacterium]
MPKVQRDTDMVEIIAAARRYEHWAFEELYNRYADKLFRFLLLRVGSRTEAEDLVAMAFERVLQRIDTFKGKSVASFSAWIYQVARNLLIDHYRRKQKMETSPLENHRGTMADKSPGPAKRVEATESAQSLYDAISTLTPVQQQVVALKFFEGMSNAEIAAVVGKSEGAVKSLQHRALASLAKIMSAEEKS